MMSGGTTMEKSHKEGAFLEKQVAAFFRRIGCEVETNKTLTVGGVRNEVDVWVTTPEGEEIIVECKQRRDDYEVVNKTVLDALLGKLTRLGIDKGLLVTTASLREAYTDYANQGVYMWDGIVFNDWTAKNTKEARNEVYERLDLCTEDTRNLPQKIVEAIKKHPKAIGLPLLALFLMGVLLVGFLALVIFFPDTFEKLVNLFVAGLALGTLLLVIGALNFIMSLLPGGNTKKRKRRKKKSASSSKSKRRRKKKEPWEMSWSELSR